MFGIGEGELMIILVFGFLLFGPDKLPQMGHTIGRALRQFRETQEKMTSVVQSEIIDPVAEAANGPVKPKKAAADSDEDIESDTDGTAAAAKKETFAERRARLAAEKAEREGGAETADAAASAPDAAPAGASSADAPSDAAPDTASPEEPADDEPAVTTTADLYARRPRKRKKEKVASIAAELEAAEAERAIEDAAPADDAPEDAAAPAAPVEGGEA